MKGARNTGNFYLKLKSHQVEIKQSKSFTKDY